MGGGANMCRCESNRNFLTNEEKIEGLTEYKESLDKESQGVSEKIQKLKKG